MLFLTLRPCTVQHGYLVLHVSLGQSSDENSVMARSGEDRTQMKSRWTHLKRQGLDKFGRTFNFLGCEMT